MLYPIYLYEIGGLNVEQIGWLNAAWGAATIVASAVAGVAIDRRSERIEYMRKVLAREKGGSGSDD